jgi:hypothetical protein
MAGGPGGNLCVPVVTGSRWKVLTEVFWHFWGQSFAPWTVGHQTPSVHPDGQCILPAVNNPGKFSLPGFLSFVAA